MKRYLPLFIFPLLVLCTNKKEAVSEMPAAGPVPGTFGYDVAFLKKHKEVIVLESKQTSAKVVLVKDYQGRVMTSSASGDEGTSYGWINYKLIESGEVKPHINPVGGEDRFWLGPEGGQFALYFRKGDPFDFDHWQTPALIDTETFDLVSADSTQATFSKSSTLTNYAGFTFSLNIQRQIRLMGAGEVEAEFDVTPSNLKSVAFQSINSITNTGPEDWSRKNGLPSIWILGMFNPSDETVVIVPYEKSADPSLVTDNYFGKIPADRISKTETRVLLRGDGKYRGKIGIAPAITKNIVGSYDAGKHILTLVKFDVDKTGAYVNSKWETQKEPFKGDAVNSYNDGPLADGSQLGPFYELESSSPARELKKGETLTHRHMTLHLEGNEKELNAVAEKILGVSLAGLNEKFAKNP